MVKATAPVKVPGQTTQVAKCPTNTYVVGGGFAIAPGISPQVTASFRDLSFSYWIASVTENNSTGKTLTVYAQCLTKSIVKQIKLSSGKNGSSSSPISTVATCAAGTYAIGGGFQYSSPQGVIYGSLPDGAHNRWSVQAKYINAGPYTLNAYGLCLTL
jgi:hypothetical protein